MKINTDPMNMDALDFDGDMWDQEYCDSELRAVEASGESREQLCQCQQTAENVHVPCNHCIRTECILIDVCIVMYVMQEPQGEQCCALMGYSWVNMT